MRLPLKRHCIPLALAAALALPATAVAAEDEYFVPPSNSAATQYTESFPTAKGQRDAERDQGEGKRRSSPALKESEARELRSHGAAGEAVAEVVIETAPTTAVEAVERERPAGERRRGGQPAGEGGNERPGKGEEAEIAIVAPTGGDGPNGSSGLGAVLAGATGLSGDGTGAPLPLAIVAAILWAFAYRRRHPASAGA